MYIVYPAIFCKEKRGYSVHFPDLGGATQGNDLKTSLLYGYGLFRNIFDDVIEGVELPSRQELKL